MCFYLVCEWLLTSRKLTSFIFHSPAMTGGLGFDDDDEEKGDEAEHVGV